MFSLEAAQGHLQWKVTDLVRKSQVSRTLIYRYLGRNKGEIFSNAFRCFIERFYGLSSTGRRMSLPDVIETSRALMETHPEAVIFYQKWRANGSPLRKEFMKIEERFQKRLRRLFPDKAAEDIVVLHAVIHGLVTAPFLTASQARHGCERLLKPATARGE